MNKRKTKPARPTAYVNPARVGRVVVAIWVSGDKRDALKRMAIDRRSSLQELIEGAVDRLLEQGAKK